MSARRGALRWVQSMATLVELNTSLENAKRDQHAARLAWRIASERYPKGDPRIRETLAAYKQAKAVRQLIDRQIARLQSATQASPKGLAFLIAEEGFIPTRTTIRRNTPRLESDICSTSVL